MKSNSIVFFGTGTVSLKTLKGISSHFPIEAVVTKPDSVTHGKTVAHPVAIWAKQHKVPAFQPVDKNQLSQLFTKKSFKSSVGLIADYGLIIPEDVINYFPKGIINSHFSLLPEWRGADPITAAILSSQAETGVSLMITEPELDTGDLIAQATYKIPTNITIDGLTNELIKLSNQLIIKTLPKYIDGKIKPKPQPKTGVSYAGKINKSAGQIDWTKPAEQLEREVRAYLGWPGSYTQLAGRNVIILKAKVKPVPTKPKYLPGEVVADQNKLMVMTGKDVLVIKELKPAGKRAMSAADFIRGYLKN